MSELFNFLLQFFAFKIERRGEMFHYRIGWAWFFLPVFAICKVAVG
jgi:hypothetical protein